MQKEAYKLWDVKEYTYKMSFGFTPKIVSYIHEEDDVIRPCMLVVPGGAYCMVSPTEGEIVAKEFYNRGYQAFVLTYTTNPLMSEPLKTQPMKDLSRAIRMIRKKACDFHINPDQLVVCGFSAGGHLSGSICVHHDDITDGNELYAAISNRPDAAILSYPVITSGEYTHKDSFRALLGFEAEKEELAYMSLEKHVSKHTPPCFIWQTAEDESVPVENSYLFANACREKGVLFSHHVFSRGGHGLSLANEVWAREEYGEPYTMDQTFRIIQKVKSGELPLSEEKREKFLLQFDFSREKIIETKVRNAANREVENWPLLAGEWLDAIWKT